MTPNVRRVLDSILERFKSGDIPAAVGFSLFPIAHIPSTKWSILNRTVMFLAGTQDARGFRQWQEANRYVKRGSKAFHILVPYIKKVEVEGGEEKEAIYGFGCKPVFRAEDTGGEPLDYQAIEVPDLPLMDRALEWGVNVKTIPGNYRFNGYYSPGRQEIALATEEECVFFHELAHCAHDKVKGGLKGGQDPFQEIVAELSALALCRIVGKSGVRYLGNSYRYIEGYAQKMEASPYAACLKVLSDTEKVLNLVLKGGETGSQAQDKLAA